jgi:NADPH-dependent ferric siderophore reductase
MLITLGGSGLTEHSWNAGDRVSIRTPDDNLRNYTPFDWDATAGRARLLCAGHASGPGTRFLNTLAVGSEVQLIGPKKSIDLHLEGGAPIIVGDETSLGLCAAWNTAHPGTPSTVLLEATDRVACRAAARAIGVAPANVETNREALIAVAVEAARANPSAPLIISGRAQTIAVVRRALKNAGVNSRPTKVKAYWDENRAGLD